MWNSVINPDYKSILPKGILTLTCVQFYKLSETFTEGWSLDSFSRSKLSVYLTWLEGGAASVTLNTLTSAVSESSSPSILRYAGFLSARAWDGMQQPADSRVFPSSSTRFPPTVYPFKQEHYIQGKIYVLPTTKKSWELFPIIRFSLIKRCFWTISD